MSERSTSELLPAPEHKSIALFSHLSFPSEGFILIT